MREITGRFTINAAIFPGGTMRPRDHVGVQITLDGGPQKRVIGFDTEKGELARYVTAADGRLLIIGEDYATEVVSGRVEAFAREGE